MTKVTNDNANKVLLCENQKYTIEDEEAGSKAFAPIRITAGNTVEVVKVDKGLITKLPEGKTVCDSLVYTVRDERNELNITLLLELKGTDGTKLVKHCLEQIMDTIGYLTDEKGYPDAAKYLRQRDLVFAAVVGAPDKTLPALANAEIRALCRKLRERSVRRELVGEMFSLLFYIQPDVRAKTAGFGNRQAPFVIRCYNNAGGAVPYPDMLLEMLSRGARK